MQLLFDFLPVIAFFVAYQLTSDIFIATTVIIVASVIQVTIHWIHKRRVKPLHLISAGLVAVFGGLTLAVREPLFIMWKVTILNWLLAAVFLASFASKFGGRTLVQRMMAATDAGFDLTPAQWRQLNWMWIGYFALLGTINLVVFQTVEEAVWVKFKFYGLIGLTLLFMLVQGFWIAAQTKEHDSPTQ